MEAPPNVLYGLRYPQTTPLQASPPITKVIAAISKLAPPSNENLKSRKVVKRAREETVPRPLDSKDHLYNQLRKQYPNLNDLLTVLRTVNDDEVRFMIIDDLIRHDKFKEAFYFIMEIKNPQDQDAELREIAIDLVDIDAVVELKLYFDYLDSTPEGKAHNRGNCAKFNAGAKYIQELENFSRALEIYLSIDDFSLRSSLFSIMYEKAATITQKLEVCQRALHPFLLQNQIQLIVALVKMECPKESEAILFDMGVFLFFNRRQDQLHFIINELTTRREELVKLVSSPVSFL